MKTLDLNPFFFPGGPIGCLLIHGGTGSPPEMRPMGEYLADRGLTVLGVRLAGHGTTPEDLATTTWQDLVASAEEGLGQLQDRCERVFVAGLSLGGLITLYLAIHRPIAGAIVMAAPAYITLVCWSLVLSLLVFGLLTEDQGLSDQGLKRGCFSTSAYPSSSARK